MKLRSRAQKAEIAAAPIADVAFLLILFFLLTSALAATRGLDLALPEPGVTTAADRPVIEIAIDRSGGLAVAGQATELEDLEAVLRPLLARDPRTLVAIVPDPASPYAATVAVLDRLRGAARRGLALRGLSLEARELPQEREQPLPTGPVSEGRDFPSQAQ